MNLNTDIGNTTVGLNGHLMFKGNYKDVHERFRSTRCQSPNGFSLKHCRRFIKWRHNCAIPLPDTETDRMGTNSNENHCWCRYLCSMNTSVQFFRIHFYRYGDQCEYTMRESAVEERCLTRGFLLYLLFCYGIE